MNVLGLKGFSRYGTINQYFTKGCFPQKNNWRRNDVDFVIESYTDYLVTTPSSPHYDPRYIAIAFSDGGTIAHQLPALDMYCIGIIAHSATFIPPIFTLQKIPILLIHNSNDLTRWLPSWYGRTKEAFRYYQEKGHPVELHELPSYSWHGHNFDNAFGIMRSWALRHFNYKLPIK